jgi:hypothetical protein
MGFNIKVCAALVAAMVLPGEALFGNPAAAGSQTGQSPQISRGASPFSMRRLHQMANGEGMHCLFSRCTYVPQ